MADCVRVCPESVFAMGRLGDADFAALPFLSRLKLRLHGRRVAFVAPDACRACWACIPACPERALRLELRPEPVSRSPGA